MRTYYIAGPMTGYAEFNYPAFYRVENALMGMGYGTINPAALDAVPEAVQYAANEDDGSQLYMYLRRDFKAIMATADGIVLIDGWEDSVGANCELLLARILGLEVVTAETVDDGYRFTPLPNVFPDMQMIDKYITELYVTQAEEVLTT